MAQDLSLLRLRLPSYILPTWSTQGPSPSPVALWGRSESLHTLPWGVWLSREMLLISSKAQPHKGRSEVHTVKEKPGHTSHSQLSLSEARPASYRAEDATSLDTRPLLVITLLLLTSLGLAGPACWPILSRPWVLSRCWGRFLCFQTSDLAGLQAVASAGLWQLSRDSVSHV